MSHSAPQGNGGTLLAGMALGVLILGAVSTQDFSGFDPVNAIVCVGLVVGPLALAWTLWKHVPRHVWIALIWIGFGICIGFVICGTR